MSRDPAPFGLSRRGHRTADQPISYLMAEALRRPGLISLAAGFVDYATLPADPVRELAEQVLADPASARAALQYGTTQGHPPLRAAIARRLAGLDRLDDDAYPPDDVVVTTGSQQSLHLLADVLLDEGDIVVTARPTYFVFTGALEAFGARVRTVEMDEHGMIPASLDAVLSELEAEGKLPGVPGLPGVKMVYVTSYFQNPTGLTLAEPRRGEIVEIVRRYSQRAGQRILIIEDAAYRELSYDAEPPPPSLRKFDEGGEHVAVLGTFSKPFAPGLKTGYALLPRGMVEPVLLQKTGRDFGSSNFNQHVLWRALESGAFEAHVERLRAAYRRKRDAMLEALGEHLGRFDGVEWTEPGGGLYVWLTLPGVDTGGDGPLFGRALEEGVLFVPGAYCYPPEAGRAVPREGIRLSFGVADEAQIRQGVARLAGALGALEAAG